MARRYLVVVAMFSPRSPARASGSSLRWRTCAPAPRGLSADAADSLKAGEAMPEVSDAESHDWLVAVSHSACVDQKTFSCVGAFKVTICQQPD
jgi:hypothetical protein